MLPWLGRQPGVSFGRVHKRWLPKEGGGGGLNARGVALPPLCDDGSGKRARALSPFPPRSPAALGAIWDPGPALRFA